MKKEFWIFVSKVLIYAAIICGLIVGVNYKIDSASVINPHSHNKMAKIVTSGQTVEVPENYNERVFQMCVVDNMKKMPETVVVGTSRGMFLGSEITGYEDMYNNCVSNGCLEDYYALLGLYYDKFNAVPSRVIIEITPWILYSGISESRWLSNEVYYNKLNKFYREVNGTDKEKNSELTIEDPYTSIYYFRYNLEQLFKQGPSILTQEAHPVRDDECAADYPDGSTRYQAESENPSPERLAKVQAMTGVLNYDSCDLMTEVDPAKAAEFENLVNYLIDNGSEVILYFQPFSVTQCEYSYDRNLNPAFDIAEDYLRSFAAAHNISVVGDYDARAFNLTDEYFIDNMHLDKAGTNIVWNWTN